MSDATYDASVSKFDENQIQDSAGREDVLFGQLGGSRVNTVLNAPPDALSGNSNGVLLSVPSGALNSSTAKAAGATPSSAGLGLGDVKTTAATSGVSLINSLMIDGVDDGDGDLQSAKTADSQAINIVSDLAKTNKTKAEQILDEIARSELDKASPKVDTNGVVYTKADDMKKADELVTSSKIGSNYEQVLGGSKEASTTAMKNVTMVKNVGTSNQAATISAATGSGTAGASTTAVGAGTAAGAGGGAAASGGASAAATAGSSASGGLIIVLVIALIMFCCMGGQIVMTIFAGAVGGAEGSETNLGGLNEVESAVAKMLMDEGYEPAQIAAVLGNLAGESGAGLNLDAVENSNGVGHGIAQWSYGRWTNLQNLADKMGKPWTDLEVQVEMIRIEIGGGWGGAYYVSPGSADPPAGTFVSGSKAGFESTGDVAEATRQFCYGWERPGIPHISKRIEYAEQYYLKMMYSGTGNDLQQAVVEAAKSGNMWGAGPGYCQAWVYLTLEAAGVPVTYSACCATGAWETFGVSTSKDNIPIGASVWGYGTTGGRCHANFGHAGLYIGDGMVAHNANGITPTIESLDSWIAKFGWHGWGWTSNVDLTKVS